MDFKAVREGAALLVDDAAGGADGEGAVGKLKLRIAVLDDVPRIRPWLVTAVGMPKSRRMKWAS